MLFRVLGVAAEKVIYSTRKRSFHHAGVSHLVTIQTRQCVSLFGPGPRCKVFGIDSSLKASSLGNADVTIDLPISFYNLLVAVWVVVENVLLCLFRHRDGVVPMTRFMNVL